MFHANVSFPSDFSQTYVSNPDGSPAPSVPVMAAIQGSTVTDTATTQSDGTAIMTLNMPSNKNPQSITVSHTLRSSYVQS